MKKKLAIFATHPVQYLVPIWRGLASISGLDVTVFYFSDHNIRGTVDPGFGVPVAWDMPLLKGYESIFISRDADLSHPHSVRIPDAVSLLRKGNYDCILIQGYTHWFEWQLIRAAKRLGIKIIIRGEFADFGKKSFFKRIVRDLYLRWFYSHVEKFCYIGEVAKKHLLRHGISSEKLFFSPYSVDTALFESQKIIFDRVNSRTKLGLNDNHFVFLFSGKLIQRKEPLLLIEAISKIQQKDNVALIIVGDGQLRESVIKMGVSVLGNRFLFQGFVNQSQIGEFFSAADAFVLPSNYETWGLVVNEAMQFGLPTIVSDYVGCWADLVIEGKTGFVFPNKNINELTKVMDWLIGNRDQAAKMGISAKHHIMAYSTDASVKGITEAIGL